MKNKLLHHDNRHTYAIVLESGDDVVHSLVAFARRNGLSRGRFIGLGGLREVLLGCFEVDGEPTLNVPISEEVGVASLTGSIALTNGEPHVDPRAIVRTADGGAWGGRLIEGLASPRLEIFLNAND
ncbi:MAG TPA: PPC domain-containing DNA-binding protein [Steroidobacteraceae bacterium]